MSAKSKPLGRSGEALEPPTEVVRQRMRRQSTRDTGPELALRRALHSLGLRYRLQQKLLPGLRRTVDIAFVAQRVAVDVRGCWWHGCDEHTQAAINNSEWWRNKLARNVERDKETEALLKARGWTVVVVWEHESPSDAAVRIAALLREARRS